MVDNNVQTADSDEIVALRRQMSEKDAENAALRQQTENATRAAEEAAAKAQGSVAARVSADRSALQSAIGAAETELEALQTAAALAMGKSQWDDVAKINTQIADATLRRSTAATQLQRLENWASRETARLAAEAAAPKPSIKEQPQAASYREYMEQKVLPGMDPRDREFLLRTGLHDSQAKWNRVVGYHEEALEQGLKLQSPEYYQYIESKFSGGTRDHGERASADDPISSAGRTEPAVIDLSRKEGEEVVKPARTAAMATGLAPSRGVGSGGSSRSRNEDEIVLSASEQEQAIRSFGQDLVTGEKRTPEQALVLYARNKKQLIDSGRLQP